MSQAGLQISEALAALSRVTEDSARQRDDELRDSAGLIADLVGPGPVIRVGLSEFSVVRIRDIDDPPTNVLLRNGAAVSARPRVPVEPCPPAATPIQMAAFAREIDAVAERFIAVRRQQIRERSAAREVVERIRDATAVDFEGEQAARDATELARAIGVTAPFDAAGHRYAVLQIEKTGPRLVRLDSNPPLLFGLASDTPAGYTAGVAGQLYSFGRAGRFNLPDLNRDLPAIGEALDAQRLAGIEKLRGAIERNATASAAAISALTSVVALLPSGLSATSQGTIYTVDQGRFSVGAALVVQPRDAQPFFITATEGGSIADAFSQSGIVAARATPLQCQQVVDDLDGITNAFAALVERPIEGRGKAARVTQAAARIREAQDRQEAAMSGAEGRADVLADAAQSFTGSVRVGIARPRYYSVRRVGGTPAIQVTEGNFLDIVFAPFEQALPYGPTAVISRTARGGVFEPQRARSEEIRRFEQDERKVTRRMTRKAAKVRPRAERSVDL